MSDYLEEYLAVRRADWPYEGRYRIYSMKDNGFMARVDDKLACVAWADETGDEAVMHMKLMPEYAEYGIGTELLHMLMEFLINTGTKTIRYTIPTECWAYQIYDNLGFTIENRTEDTINFIKRIEG